MFTLTEPAAAKVKALLGEEDAPTMRLRVAVRPGGCSGFSYEMFFDADVNLDDAVFEIHGAPRRRRCRIVAAPGLSIARLSRRLAGRRLQDDQPQRSAHLRLRSVVLVARAHLPFSGASSTSYT